MFRRVGESLKFSKLKDESGSTMLLAIFLIVIISIVIISFSVQVGNQIKSTMNADEDIQAKYDAESEIEDGIAEFIKGIDVSYMDDIYVDTGKVNENKNKIYEKYIYYIVDYSDNIGYGNIDILNDIENKVDDGGITILSKKELVTNVEEDKIREEKPKFDSDNTNSGTKFTLRFLESEFMIRSCVFVNVKFISGVKGQEKCSISYEVDSWRIND